MSGSAKLLIGEQVTLYETPISLISYSHVTSGTALPTHTTGDLLVGIGYRSSNTAISAPAGWTTELSAGLTGYYVHIATKTAASGSETATWTNTEAVTYVVLRTWGGTGLSSRTADVSTSNAELRDGDFLDVKNGTSFVLHATFANTSGVSQTITPSDPFYTNNSSVVVGNINCSLLYRAGLIDELPTTTLSYSGSGSSFVGACLEVTA